MKISLYKIGVRKLIKRGIVLICIAAIAVILGGCSRGKNEFPEETTSIPQLTEIIEVDKVKVSYININMHCFVTEQVIEGEAYIPSDSGQFDAVVHELNALQGKKISEDEYDQGEAPQAEIYIYDKNDNIIEHAMFGVFCVWEWRNNQVYKIDHNVYEKLGQLCEKYGKCHIYSVD